MKNNKKKQIKLKKKCIINTFQTQTFEILNLIKKSSQREYALEEYKKNGTLESWKLIHHTPKQREEYFERYGSLLADFRLDSQTIGIYKVVTYKFLQLLSELFVVIMVTQMRRLETTAVLLIMSFNLVQLGYSI